MGENMKKFMTGVALIALVSTGLSAQTENMDGAENQNKAMVETQTSQDLMLNVGTPITLAVAEEVNSSTHREGDMFKLTVLNDVMIGQTVVIPRGTPATAEITWRTGKGAFGKSGKIEFGLRNIELNGKRIPITGEFRQEGEGNTVATGVGLLAVGVFAGFITGKKARLPVGRELMSQLAQNVTFTKDGKVSSSFDSDAAVNAALSNTALGKCQIAAKALETEKKQEKARKECYAEKMD
jgi:hypothetical protein